MSGTLQATKNFVGGEWVEAVDGRTQPVINPATGAEIAAVPKGSPADVERAVKAAARAKLGWAEMTPSERAGMLLALAESLDAHAEELTQLESINVGKPIVAARAEIAGLGNRLRFFAGAARCLEGRASGEYVRGYTSMIRREPIGIAGQIVPWNYPLAMTVGKIGPALAMGNVVVLKPAEQTPLTALRLAELAAQIFPPGVLNVITGDGSSVGAALARHPDVDIISLTGDSATGKDVARGAASSLKRVHLELGGKAPAIVLDDADPAEVARVLRIGGYWNAGQDCGAACRVLAGAKTHDRLLEELIPAVQSITVGDPSSGEHVEMGPLAHDAQQRRVLGFLERAVAEKACIATGGQGREPGFFIEPTVVIDVDQCSEIVQREIFGPVVTVQRVEDVDQALALANDTVYGLAASVFTRDISQALYAARKLNFGTVWINDHLVATPEMPWGGFKQSGYGKELSIYSLEDYSQIKHVMVKVGR